MPIYCDESGFTGNNMLNIDQPHFSYASVHLSENESEKILMSFKQKHNIRQREIKCQSLLSKGSKYKDAIDEIFIQLLDRTKITYADKIYSLACSFFEHIFEPVLIKKISLFRDNLFDKYIIYTLYTYINDHNKIAQSLFVEFEKFMRNKESNLFSLNISMKNHGDECIFPIIEFVSFHKDIITKEFSKNSVIKKWILDKSTTLFYRTICDWTVEIGNLNVICDKSKPLEYHARLFNKYFIDRKDQLWEKIRGKNFPLIPHLSQPISFRDSKDIPGLQLADIMASTTTYSVKNYFICPYADKWYHKLLPHVSASFTPGDDYPHTSRPETLKNIIILDELLDRSRQNQDLLDGIEEKFLFADRFVQEYLLRKTITHIM